MDRDPHAGDTWTGHTLIGPGTTEYNLCTLSGQLAVHRQLVSSLRHNRYLGQSEEDVHLICEIIIHSCGKHLLYILKIEE